MTTATAAAVATSLRLGGRYEGTRGGAKGNGLRATKSNPSVVGEVANLVGPETRVDSKPVAVSRCR